jgi:hypothetical protein
MEVKMEKISDLQAHYFTNNDNFYSTEEIIEGKLEGKWIPYAEYLRVLNQIIKLKKSQKINSNII